MAVIGIVRTELSSKQSVFVDALLAGATVATAAKTAGISPRTAARWRKDPVLVAELAARREELFVETLDAFRTGMPTAMAFVLGCIKDKDAPQSVRLRAAQIWMEHGLEIHIVRELKEELSEIRRLSQPSTPIRRIV
jgi:phage terminase small subunit